MKQLNQLIKEQSVLEKKIEAEAKKQFPPGTSILFKHGHMKKYAEGYVEVVSCWHGRVDLLIINCHTGNVRSIPYSAVK